MFLLIASIFLKGFHEPRVAFEPDYLTSVEVNVALLPRHLSW